MARRLLSTKSSGSAVRVRFASNVRLTIAKVNWRFLERRKSFRETMNRELDFESMVTLA